MSKFEHLKPIRYRKLTIPYSVPYKEFKSQISHCHVQVTKLNTSFQRMPVIDRNKIPKPYSNNDLSLMSSPADVLDYLEKYDSNSQLILLSLLTRQPSKFKKFISEANNTILQKCAEIIKFSQDFNFLEEALGSEIKASREKTIAIIFAIVLDCVHTNANGSYTLITTLLDLLMKSDISFDQVEIIDPQATKMSACFLLLELILKMKGVKSCVKYMRTQDSIQQLLKIGNIARDSYIMYGDLLCTIMERAFKSKKIHSAIDLFKFNFNMMKTPPPGSDIWGSLVLATLLSKDTENRPAKVFSIASKLLSSGINVPHRLQRAVFIYLKRAHYKDSAHLFNRSPVYQLVSNIPVSSSPKIPVDSDWTEQEMRSSIKQVWKRICLESSQMKEVDMIVNITKETVRENLPGCLVEPVEMLAQKYLRNDVEEPLHRLNRVIEEIRLDLPNHVFISISLSFRGART